MPALQTVNLVFIGDSEFSAHDGTSIPDEVTSALSGVADITMTNFGSPGQTLTQQLNGYDNQPGAAFDPGFNRNICVIHHGSNDNTTENTLANWEAQAQTMVDRLIATGYEVITTEAYQWLFDDFPGFIFNSESDWEAYNSTVGTVTGIKAVINISAVPQLNTQANVGNVPYYIDTEHLSATGAALWASFGAPIVSQVILSRGPVFSGRLRIGRRG